MTLKGYIDRTLAPERAKQQLRDKHGQDYEPPFGWDAFLGVGNEAPPPYTCPQCGQPAYELRPYGQDPQQGICEDCAAKDPALAAKRWLEENPRG